MEPIKYKGWIITHWLKPIPSNKFDYEGTHENYDGAEDAYDDRAFCAESVEACKQEIDDWSINHE